MRSRTMRSVTARYLWDRIKVSLWFMSLVMALAALLLSRLLGGLQFGYKALIQHYSLRWLVTRRHLLPLRLIPFMEYAVNLIFLRRVGGSYIFVHRLLMDHFAEMETQPNKPGA